MEHIENCDSNLFKTVVINPALHQCMLYKSEAKSNWHCDGIYFVKDGCAQSGKCRYPIGDKT